MPSYKVTIPRFHDGVLYSPTGKRPILHTDKPYPAGKLPAGLVPIKEESAALRKKREAAQKKVAKKIAADKKDIAEASFMGDGEAAAGSTIETL